MLAPLYANVKLVVLGNIVAWLDQIKTKGDLAYAILRGIPLFLSGAGAGAIGGAVGAGIGSDPIALAQSEYDRARNAAAATQSRIDVFSAHPRGADRVAELRIKLDAENRAVEEANKKLQELMFIRERLK